MIENLLLLVEIGFQIIELPLAKVQRTVRNLNQLPWDRNSITIHTPFVTRNGFESEIARHPIEVIEDVPIFVDPRHLPPTPILGSWLSSKQSDYPVLG